MQVGVPDHQVGRASRGDPAETKRTNQILRTGSEAEIAELFKSAMNATSR